MKIKISWAFFKTQLKWHLFILNLNLVSVCIHLHNSIYFRPSKCFSILIFWFVDCLACF